MKISSRRLLISLPVALAMFAICFTSPSAAAPAPQGEKDPLVVEAEALVHRIESTLAEKKEVEAKLARATGEQRTVHEKHLSEIRGRLVENVFALSENVRQQKEKGLEAAKLTRKTTAWLEMLIPEFRKVLADTRRRIVRLRRDRESQKPAERGSLEEKLAKENATLDEAYRLLLQDFEHLEALGVDVAREKRYLTERVSDRAELLAGQIKLALEQMAEAKEMARKNPDNADYQALLRAADAKRTHTAASLSAMVEILEKLGTETAAYKQLLIGATGEITRDIFDTQVAVGLVQQWTEGLKGWAVSNGPHVLFKIFLFLLILAIFKLLARFTRRLVSMSLASSKIQVSQLLQNMFVSMASRLVMLLGLLVALSQLGFQVGPLLAGLGVVGFIVGFALQDTLSNFASGFMILLYRPYDVGDLIEAAGAFGKVSHMNLVSTTILTVDNQTLVVPNSKIWGDVIKNVTAQRIRRVDLVFGISYADDIEHAEKVLREILDEHEKVLEHPEPVVKLHTLGESSVDFVVRPWVHTADYWDVYWDVTREVKMRFDQEGISIPFPQRDIHFYPEKRQAGTTEGEGTTT